MAGGTGKERTASGRVGEQARAVQRKGMPKVWVGPQGAKPTSVGAPATDCISDWKGAWGEETLAIAADNSWRADKCGVYVGV